MAELCFHRIVGKCPGVTSVRANSPAGARQSRHGDAEGLYDEKRLSGGLENDRFASSFILEVAVV
jgi:hypothetical protein